MADATKNIRFKTEIQGSEEVEKKFEDINDAIKDTSNVADTKLKPAMVDAKQYTMRVGKAAEGTTSKFAGLVGGIVGAAGVVAAMYLMAEVSKQIQEELKSTSEKVSELTERLKENWSEAFKVERAWDEFRATIAKWTVAEQTESLRQLEEELISLMPTFWEYVIATAMGGDAWKAFNKTFETSIKQIELLRKSLKGDTGQGILTNLQNELDALMLKRQNALTEKEIADYNVLIASKQNEINELLGKNKGTVREILDDWVKIGLIIDQDVRDAIKRMDDDLMVDPGDPTARTKWLQSKANKGGGGFKRGKEYWEEKFGGKDSAEQYQQDFVDSFTNILETNFSTFWTATFGEANSLLEQLLQATFGSIFANIASGLLSFIPGGSIVGGIVDLFSKPSSGGNNSNTPIVIQLGGEDVARVVLEGNRVIQQRRLS